MDPNAEARSLSGGPNIGELWAGPTGDEWHVLADHDGRPWLARPVEGADLAGWRLAADADPQSEPAWTVSPNDLAAALARLMRGDQQQPPLPTEAISGVTATYPVTDVDGSTGTERFHISSLGLAMLAQARAARTANAVHVARDGQAMHAVCPHCGGLDKIAELDEAARVNPIVFSQGIDNDNVYFTIVSTHSDAQTQRYVCRACMATVTIPPDITFAGLEGPS